MRLGGDSLCIEQVEHKCVQIIAWVHRRGGVVRHSGSLVQACCTCGVGAPAQHVQPDQIVTAAVFAGPSFLQNLTRQWTLGHARVFIIFLF
jgi:hypothetical protein